MVGALSSLCRRNCHDIPLIFGSFFLLAVTPDARREARAHDPSLASPSSPTLQPLQPQDSFSMPSMPVHSDPSMLGGVSSFSPVHFSDAAACSPVASPSNGDGFWAASLTQNNPLYRSYDEVNGSLDEFSHASFDRDSLDDVGGRGVEADVESIGGNDNEDDCGVSHNPRGESHVSETQPNLWPGFVPHGHLSKANQRNRQKNIADFEITKPLGRKYSSGFSSNSDSSDDNQYADYDEVYDPATSQFAAQLSKSIKEKLLSPKTGQEGDVQQKLKVSPSALPPISSSSSSSTSSKPGAGGARSLLVRTLTMPLKYAAQHRQSLTKVFSRSQPSTPELPRRNQVARSYVRPEQVNRNLPSSPYNVDSHKLELLEHSSPGTKGSSSKKKTPQGRKSPSGKPPKPPAAHHKPITRKSSNLSRQASFRNPFPTPPAKSPPPNALDSWPANPCNNPILEPCTTCARNVAANIQHASIWGDLDNLPRGYLANVEESKMVNYKRKTKEDCKLQ